jgi:hypothetical protein
MNPTPAPSAGRNRRPLWQELARRFPDPRDCLSAFIALETAELQAGVKPASLINVVNRPRSCGRNLYTLWREHGPALLRDSPLRVRELCDRGDALLLLFYREEHLEALLRQGGSRALLRRAGYAEPLTAVSALEQLAARLRDGGFPHEIGIFLGYPLKDVAAFMGWARLPFTCQGPWRIYGRAEESLRLAEQFRRCRHQMARQLACCSSPADCLARCDGRAAMPTASAAGRGALSFAGSSLHLGDVHFT